MRKIQHFISFILLIIAITIIFPAISIAKDRTVITDWYIKDFQSEIVVNYDSSITITEKITADCGNLTDKHGIFRILPTRINTTDQGKIKTPVSLISITDFNGTHYNYSTTNNSSDHTVTWKIGDASTTVTGMNYYLIKYRVDNAIRTHNSNFDELYWNLNGNFWDIETDNFTATIKFPQEVKKSGSEVYIYDGETGSKSNNLATFKWIDDNTLTVSSDKTLLPRQGITASVTFPENIVTPYKEPLASKYGWLTIFILPILTLGICFKIWKKYGDDPEWDKTIIPEYDIPNNLTPLELGTLKSNGTVSPNFITATIINFAVNGIITIEETKKESVLNFFNSKELIFHLKNEGQNLGKPEKKILEMIFGEKLSAGEMATLSDIKKKMQSDRTFSKDLENMIIDRLAGDNLIEKPGNTARKIMLPISIVIIFSFFFTLGSGLIFFSLGLLLSGVIMLIFSIIMPKRTLKGAELNWKIKGFELFMETAEKYRQQFFEKENMFEKLLPYAMVFGMTKEWIKKMEEIYGKDYFTNYHPVWYTGGTLASFDADSFTSQINSISSSMNSVSSSASGAGGGGSSGGGGGGGGGGGW